MVLHQPTTTELAAELAAQRAEVTALRARLDGQKRTQTRRRVASRRLRTVAAAGLLTVLAPLGILAAGPSFTDLNDAAEVHRSDIQAIANAGITTGIDDPNSDDPNARLYKPNDPVSRQEMASFLARLGGLNGNTPIINAATAVNAQTATTAQTALGVAPGAITAAGINADGATPGQVLTVTGDGAVAFQTPQGGGGGEGTGAAAGNAPNSIAIPISTTLAPLQTVTIIAPSAGYVQVNGLVATQLPLLPVATTVTVQLQNTTTSQTSPGVATSLNISVLGPQPMDETWVFPVQAGPNTFTISASANVLGTIAVQTELSALFVPATVVP